MRLSSSAEIKQLAKRGPKEQLENSFLSHWVLLFPNLPLPVRQLKFHPERKWRWDFAWDFPDIKLAVEIQGGSWMKRSGHNTAAGQTKDYEKWRAGVSLGWKILPYSSVDMKHVTSVVTEVAEILTNSKELS